MLGSQKGLILTLRSFCREPEHRKTNRASSLTQVQCLPAYLSFLILYKDAPNLPVYAQTTSVNRHTKVYSFLLLQSNKLHGVPAACIEFGERAFS